MLPDDEPAFAESLGIKTVLHMAIRLLTEPQIPLATAAIDQLLGISICGELDCI